MALQPDELARFCEVLHALLSSDNARRQESEQVYEAAKQRDPDRLCRCLIAVLMQAPDDVLRQESAVLLRQCLKPTRSDFVWPQVPLQSQKDICTQLAALLQIKQTRYMRHKIGDVVSTLASHVLDQGMIAAGDVCGWPELHPALVQLLDSADSDDRETALRVVRSILATNPPAIQPLVEGKLGPTLQVCHCDACPYFRKEALLLYTAVLEHLPPSVWHPLRALMPQMLAIMKSMENDDQALKECIEAFVQVADIAPSALQNQLGEVVQMMLAICHARERFSDNVRQMAFEFLASLSEKRAKMCAKFPNFIREVVQVCMEFMLEIEDDEDWSDAANAASRDDTSANYDVGSENIDRFAKAIGAAAVLEHVFANVRQFVGSEHWKQRYVAIMTLSQCAETVEDEKHVDEIVVLLVELLKDNHPRVRYAALHAIGQTSTDHSPYIQEEHHELLLPALSRLMEDSVPRVSAHACAAFVNFGEELHRELLLPHVPSLMAKLVPMMTATTQVQREQAITAIAVIAGVIEVEFVQYYQHVMPVLKQVVLMATAQEERAMRGKAFECMSLLGLAVGRQVFGQDAREAMEAMLCTASRGLDADDPQKSYIHEAAQRICHALKNDFLPYLHYLLPGVLATLQMQPSEVVDPEGGEASDMTLAFLKDGAAVGLKTTQIEDFKSAVQMLACFLEVLGGHFYDHIRDTARCLLPALTFRFSDDVKRDAIQAWQDLISAANAGQKLRQLPDDGLVTELIRGFLQNTVQAMRAEEDLEILQVQAIGIASCIKAAGPGSMTIDEVRELCAQVKALVDESTQRQRSAQLEEVQDEDEDAEREHRRDADQMARLKYAELLGVLMEVHKQAFLTVGLQEFVPVMQECLAPGRSASDRYLALYLADDMLEKLGREAANVWPTFMEPMLEAIVDEDAWVRQAAAYGVLHAARLAEFAPAAARSAGLLAEAIAHPGARSEGNLAATEAAVAALGVLCHDQISNLGAVAEQHLSVFLNGLPLVEDLDQAGPTHELLMEFVGEGNAVVKAALGKVVRVFLEVYERDTSTTALNAAIRRLFLEAGEECLLRQLQPPLNEKQRKRAQKILRDAKKFKA